MQVIFGRSAPSTAERQGWAAVGFEHRSVGKFEVREGCQKPRRSIRMAEIEACHVAKPDRAIAVVGIVFTPEMLVQPLKDEIEPPPEPLFRHVDQHPDGECPVVDLLLRCRSPHHQFGFRLKAKFPISSSARLSARDGVWLAKPEGTPLHRRLRLPCRFPPPHCCWADLCVRLSDTARGRSFDATFAESYERAPIRKATEEQRRLWLMGQEVRRLHRRHGMIRIHENEYWSDWMNEFAGQDMIARFDPEDLHAGVYIYRLTGEFMGFAECKAKVGFFDMASAREAAAANARRRRAEKRYLQEIRPTPITRIAAELDAIAPQELPAPEAKVVELAQRQRGPVVERPMPRPAPADSGDYSAFVVAFQQRDSEPRDTETPADRFRRALDIEARAEAGQPVGAAEADWLRTYQGLPEYRSQRRAYEEWGESALG